MPYQRSIQFGATDGSAHQCQEPAQLPSNYFDSLPHLDQISHNNQQWLQRQQQQQPIAASTADTNQGYGQAMTNNYCAYFSKYDLYNGEAANASQNFPSDLYESNNQSSMAASLEGASEEVPSFYHHTQQFLPASQVMMSHPQTMAYVNNQSIPLTSFDSGGVTFPTAIQERRHLHYNQAVSSYGEEQQLDCDAPSTHHQHVSAVPLSNASRRRQLQQQQQSQSQYSHYQSLYSSSNDRYNYGGFPEDQAEQDDGPYVQYQQEDRNFVPVNNYPPPPPPPSLDEVGTSTYSLNFPHSNLQFCTPSSGLVLIDEAHLLDDTNLPHLYHLPSDVGDDLEEHPSDRMNQCQTTASVIKLSSSCQLVASVDQTNSKFDLETRLEPTLSNNNDSLLGVIARDSKSLYTGNCSLAKPNGQIEAQQALGSLYTPQSTALNKMEEQNQMNDIASNIELDQVLIKLNSISDRKQHHSNNQQDYIDIRSSGSLSQDWLDTVCRHMIEHMNSFGICVIDNFLGSLKGELILKEVLRLYSNRNYTNGKLVSAKLEGEGRSESGAITSSSSTTTTGSNQLAKKHVVQATNTIRNDRVIWVDGCEDGCEEINNLIQTFCSVITNSSRLSLYSNNGLDKIVINKRTKAHVACYPGNGTRYIKHVDNPNGDGRVITAIYYLNKSWNTSRDGGLLRMFPAGMDEVANIEPLFDRVLFFWSDRRNPHEVLPAFRDRFAITVWYIGESRTQ